MKSDCENWTMAETIAWVCTRDNEVVRAIQNPQTADALRAQFLTYGSRIRLEVSRVPETGKKEYSLIDLTNGEFSKAGDALEAVHEAILAGEIPVAALDGQTGSWGTITPAEMLDLEFRSSPGETIRSVGFWSKTTGECRWVLPQLPVLAIQRRFPAPKLSPTGPAERRIGRRLLEITADAKLKKEAARELCESVPGFFGRGFERAWRALSAERKLGRGKHGPKKVKR